jgi:hypothetical protein
MSVYKRVKPAMQSEFATIVPLHYARNTSVWSTIRLPVVFRLYER